MTANLIFYCAELDEIFISLGAVLDIPDDRVVHKAQISAALHSKGFSNDELDGFDWVVIGYL